MAASRLPLAGLLLLLAVPGSLALRTLSERGTPAGDPYMAFTRSLSRDNRTRFKTLQDLKEAVAKHIQEARTAEIPGLPMGIPGAWPTCRTKQSACKLSDLAPGKPTSIYPGGRTQCLFGAEFSFQVYPGASDKLYIHLGGGGACWDEVTSNAVGACKTEVQLQDNLGFFTKCPGPNPFDGFTVVWLPSCSGDLFAGNVTWPWKTPDNLTAAANGYAQVRAAVDWARARMDPQLSQLVVGGDSAGSIGTQMWASALLRELRPRQARILVDSYIGVLPAGFQQKLFRDLGACDLFFNSTDPLFEKCHGRNLTVQEVYGAAMREFPEAIFGTSNSKHDQVQLLFHGVAAASQAVDRAVEYCGHVDPAECDLSNAPPELSQWAPPMTEAEYHQRAEEIIEGYTENPNYVSLLMSGKAHDVFYNAIGDCDLQQLSHDPSASWLEGHQGPQRLSAQKWALDFFGASRTQYSVCDRLDTTDEDDYCIDKQMLKRVT